MKKSYLKKNVLAGVLTYLCSGWQKEELSFTSCEIQHKELITCLSGDIVYFTFADDPSMYSDFIIRFGLYASRETLQDIDIFSVRKKNGKAVRYSYEFCVHTEGKSMCVILAEVLLGISFILK